MKSVDPLTLLTPAAATPGEAPHKGAPAAGAGFTAILAEANDQEAAAAVTQGKSSPDKVAALPQPSAAPDDAANPAEDKPTTAQAGALDVKATARKGMQPGASIALPQQARSIHDSITRSTRGLAPRAERTLAASALRGPPAPLLGQVAATATEPDGATSQVATDDPFALALSAEEPADSANDAGALQAVLGQVASVITGIVVPPMQPVQTSPNQVAVAGPRAIVGQHEQAVGVPPSPSQVGRDGEAAGPTTPRGNAPQFAVSMEAAATAQTQAALVGGAEGAREAEAPLSGMMQPGQSAQVSGPTGPTRSAAEPRVAAGARDARQAQQDQAVRMPDAGQAPPAVATQNAAQLRQLPLGTSLPNPPQTQQPAAPSQPGAVQTQQSAALSQPGAEQPAALSPPGVGQPQRPLAANTEGRVQAWGQAPSAPPTNTQAEPSRGSLSAGAQQAPAMPGTVQTQAVQTQPGQVQSAQTQSVQTQSGQTQQAQTQQAQTQQAQTQQAQTQQAQTQPGQGQQAQTQAAPLATDANGPRSGMSAADAASLPPGFAATGPTPPGGADSAPLAALTGAPPSVGNAMPRSVGERGARAYAQNAPQSPATPALAPAASTPTAAGGRQPAHEDVLSSGAAPGSRNGVAVPATQPLVAAPGRAAQRGLAPSLEAARVPGLPDPIVAPEVAGWPAAPRATSPSLVSPADAQGASVASASTPSPLAGAPTTGAVVATPGASTANPVSPATVSVTAQNSARNDATSASSLVGQPARSRAQPAAPTSSVVSTLDTAAADAATLAGKASVADSSAQGAPVALQPGQRGLATEAQQINLASPPPALVQSGLSPSSPGVEAATVLSALSASATTPSGESAGKPVAKPNQQTDDRIHGFTRGALFGSAMSAYTERAHGDTHQDSPTRGRHADDQAHADERSAKAEPAFTLDRPQQVEQQLMGAQLQVKAPDAPLLAPAPAAPVPVPVPTPPVNVPDVVFAARPPGSQPEAASISIHHPDLGAIQLEVHRDRGRVEVHAVIESVHAEAVLRANESGIRQGVQQSGMTFSALRVRVRGEEPQTARPAQSRRRRADEREK